MEEHIELLKQIYEDSEMACFTIQDLTIKLKEKDNKIKKVLEDILVDYMSYKEKAKNELKENGEIINTKSILSKMMASMGIKKEVIIDNSDSKIAEMLIKGISMGSLNTERFLKSYKHDCDKKHLKLGKDFLKFQEKAIEQLKEYL